MIKYMKYANELAEKVVMEIKNDYSSNDYVHVCSYGYGKHGNIIWELKKIPYDISEIVTEDLLRAVCNDDIYVGHSVRG